MSPPPEQDPRSTQIQDASRVDLVDPVIVVPSAPDLTGVVLLDRYRVLSKLGAGGMGTVYLGEHVVIGKRFAIKVLSHQYAHRADLVQRFLQEARAASMIAQQNVVEISDFGDTPDGSVFFVMEYLDGEDLAGLLLREQRIAWERVRHLLLQVCRALEAAHAAGIIHRDMKPDNCFRIQRGKDPDFIKVLDFGIAKIQTSEPGAKGLTQTGMIFGTPEYMSPEQAQGERVDHRVDIYAVGVIMFELLVGHVPFSGATFMAILAKHMFEVPKAPSELVPDAQIPPEAEAIVLKAMQKDAAYRFQTMAEMIAAIEAVGTGASAVEVVQESIVRPPAGPTSFAVSEPGPMPASSSGSKRRGVLFGVGGVLIAAAAIGYAVFVGIGQAQEAPAAEVVTHAPEPRPDPPAEVAAPAVVPVAVPAIGARANVHIDTNVPAQVLDARDRAILGRSSNAELGGAGIELERSDEPTQLILRADGYDELTISVVPDSESKSYRYELQAIETKRGKSTRPRTPEPDPEPEPSSPTPPTLPVIDNDSELKNPFNK